MENVSLTPNNLEKKQPSNLEAEQALLGSILVNNDIIDEISNIISLFLYSSNIFPGSEQFDDIMDNFNALICENLKMKTVMKLKTHLDEYD